VEIIKREAADEAFQRLVRLQQHQQIQQTEADRQRLTAEILRVKQNDPLAPQVQARLDEYVKSQPLDWQKDATYRVLATDPYVYKQMYDHFRAEIERGGQGQQDQQGQPQQGQPQQTTRSRAPRLERGGGDRRLTSEEAARRKILNSKNQALASGDMDALGKFLDDAGVIDPLL
jgi:hypothetical protein